MNPRWLKKALSGSTPRHVQVQALLLLTVCTGAQ